MSKEDLFYKKNSSKAKIIDESEESSEDEETIWRRGVVS